MINEVKHNIEVAKLSDYGYKDHKLSKIIWKISKYLLIVLIIVAVLFSVIGSFLIVLDLTRDHKFVCSCPKQFEGKPCCCPAPVAEPVVEEKPVVEEQPVVEEPVVEEKQIDEDSVVFQHAKAQTLEERYQELSAEAKGYYDELVRYAGLVEGVKSFKNTRYEDFKVGYSKVVRLSIKKGVIVCEFVFQNYDFKYYIKGNKVNVKQAPVTLRVADEVSLEAAKGSIDIAVKAIQEEKAYKKQLAKAKRQQAKG